MSVNLPIRMNQWCGINSLAYFLPITFERNIGLSTQLSLVISGVLGIQYFIVSWLFVYLSLKNSGMTSNGVLVLTFSLSALAVARC